MSVLQQASEAKLREEGQHRGLLVVVDQTTPNASRSIGKASVETVLLGIVLFVSYWLVLATTSLMSLPFASISLGIVAVFLSLLVGGTLWVVSHYVK